MMLKVFAVAIICSSAFSIPPSDALQRLIEGNERYMEDELIHPDRSSDRRMEISEKQKPFATIVGCSDSRVAPEIIFDQGLGDLFIVRLAGNVVDGVGLDSVEYSIKYLGSSLVLVMGHESCGAITAVVDGQTADIEKIAELVKPAVKTMKNIEEATKANVLWTVEKLKKAQLIKRLIEAKKLDVVGAYYHLGTGMVEILE